MKKNFLALSSNVLWESNICLVENNDLFTNLEY